MGGQCIGLLSIEAGNLYLAELLTEFVDAVEAHRMRPVVVLGRTWRSPIDNEAICNEVFRLVPWMGFKGQVVASALLSTYQDISDLPQAAALADADTVYLGGSVTMGQKSVEIDATPAIRAAVRHLALVHECPRVACVTGPIHNPETVQRLRAYRLAVRELGLPWEASWEEAGDFTVEGGQRAIRHLMERLPGLEAVFFMSDAMALGALRWFESQRIPGHRRPRFIGFDDIEELQYLDIPLTTISQPLDCLMDECLKRLVNPALPPEGHVPAELVLRRSCGCSHEDIQGTPRSAFHDGLDLLFALQRVRLASQALLRDNDPATWETRLGSALARMELPWAGVLEWRKAQVPTSWSLARFHRYCEYEAGDLREDRTLMGPSPDILAILTGAHPGALVILPLISANRFLGLLLLRHVPGLEQTYDALASQIGTAFAISFPETLP